MGGANTTIIASTLLIVAAGSYHILFSKTSGNTATLLTRVFVGGYLLALIASFFDLIGFGVGQVAGWILMLAVGVSVLTVMTDIVNRIQTQQLSQAGTSGGAHGVK